MGTRTAGDVYIRGDYNVTAADATTSGGATILSVNTSGAYDFAVTNSGSINIYITGSFNGTFFGASVGVVRTAGAGGAAALTSTVECVSASTIATFRGPYAVIRVVANSGSGVYRAALTYR